MKSILKSLDRWSLSTVRKVKALAAKEGVNVFLVGGIVRDLMLKRKNIDLDFIVESNAIVLAKKFASMEKVMVLNHPQFMTATVTLSGRCLDFATARKETYAYFGALPAVSPGTIKEDLFRRDFTINAMALSLLNNDLTVLVDPFGGEKDLKAKKVRILHAKSFEDDPTRILRAVRFEQRLSFKIEARTLRYLKKAVLENYPSYVKPPRYFAEFIKILKEEKPLPALKRLKQLGALQFLENPSVVDWQALAMLDKKIPKLKKSPAYKNYENWWQLYLFALCAKGKPHQAENLITRFSLTKAVKKSILEIQRKSDIIKPLQNRPEASEVYRRLHPLTKACLIYWRATLTNPKEISAIDRYLNKYAGQSLAIGGEDILRLGLKEKEKIGEILNAVLMAKIDGKVKAKRNQLTLARRLICK